MDSLLQSGAQEMVFFLALYMVDSRLQKVRFGLLTVDSGLQEVRFGLVNGRFWIAELYLSL